MSWALVGWIDSIFDYMFRLEIEEYATFKKVIVLMSRLDFANERIGFALQITSNSQV